jgi:hypothetical protein
VPRPADMTLATCGSRIVTVRAAIAEAERKRAATRDALALMRKALTDWQEMLRAETRPARTALTTLLKGRLIFTRRSRLLLRGRRHGGADHRWRGGKS